MPLDQFLNLKSHSFINQCVEICIYNILTQKRSIRRSCRKSNRAPLQETWTGGDLQQHGAVQQQWRTPVSSLGQANPAVPTGQWAFTATLRTLHLQQLELENCVKTWQFQYTVYYSYTLVLCLWLCLCILILLLNCRQKWIPLYLSKCDHKV